MVKEVTVTVRCLSVNVYRCSLVDCTNGGVSSRSRTLLIACPDGPVKVDSKDVPENFCLAAPDYGGIELVVYPATVTDGEVVKRPGHWMHGGNIVASCDSRYRDWFGGPMWVFDRQEW